MLNTTSSLKISRLIGTSIGSFTSIVAIKSIILGTAVVICPGIMLYAAAAISAPVLGFLIGFAIDYCISKIDTSSQNPFLYTFSRPKYCSSICKSSNYKENTSIISVPKSIKSGIICDLEQDLTFSSASHSNFTRDQNISISTQSIVKAQETKAIEEHAPHCFEANIIPKLIHIQPIKTPLKRSQPKLGLTYMTLAVGFGIAGLACKATLLGLPVAIALDVCAIIFFGLAMHHDSKSQYKNGLSFFNKYKDDSKAPLLINSLS